MAKQSDPKTKIIKLLVLIILCLVAVLTLLLFPTALWKAGTQVVDRTAVGEYGDRTIRRAAELPPATESEPPVPEPTVPSNVGRKATILYVGDVLMHSYLINGGETADGGYDYDYMFQQTKAFTEAADYAICNMEGTLGGAPYTGYPLFSAPDELARAMVTGGFDAATNASNHTIDRGYDGILRTNRTLKDAGLDVLGTRVDTEDQTWIIRDINTIKVGFSNYTYETPRQNGRRALNGITMPEGGEELVDSFGYEEPYMTEDLERMKARVAEMRAAGAEAVIFILHWGTEYSSAENDYQVRIARTLADAGADAIFSCGPHVLQPVKIVQSADGSHALPVFYSGGNFVSDQLFSTADNQGRAEDGLMMTVQLERLADGDVKVTECGYVLTYCYKNKYADTKTYNTPIPVRAALADPEAYGATDYRPLLEASLARSEQLMSGNEGSEIIPIRELREPGDLAAESRAIQ
jgi:poly-gamma-glutamate capsule biosynthesis protein CapA/YwtB (metallophosphatase superfamily)